MRQSERLSFERIYGDSWINAGACVVELYIMMLMLMSMSIFASYDALNEIQLIDDMLLDTCIDLIHLSIYTCHCISKKDIHRSTAIDCCVFIAKPVSKLYRTPDKERSQTVLFTDD